MSISKIISKNFINTLNEYINIIDILNIRILEHNFDLLSVFDGESPDSPNFAWGFHWK